MRTQLLVARYLAANGWPYAESTGGARRGADVTGTPGLALEVKARTDLSPLSWVRQAEANAGGSLPAVVFRCNGQGEDAGAYLAMLRLEHLVTLLRLAGYGDEVGEGHNPQPLPDAETHG